MYISHQALKRAVRLTGLLAHLDDHAEFIAVALPALGELVGCDVLTYADYPAGALVFVGYVREHPLVSYYPATPASVFQNIPVEHQIAVNLPVWHDRTIDIAFNRSAPGFTESERTLLTVLQTPLVAALRHTREDMGADHVRLTGREAQILRLVALGRTDGAIARELRVSTRTIAKHLEHVYRKLGVSNRAAVVAWSYGKCQHCGAPRHSAGEQRPLPRQFATSLQWKRTVVWRWLVSTISTASRVSRG